MSILEEILGHKRESLSQAKSTLPFRELKARVKDIATHPFSFKSAIRRTEDMPIRLIAEIKKASPGRGMLREDFNLLEIVSTYDRKDVSAISVLTEEHFFQGKLDHLRDARKITRKPLLRKDFIFDEYQVYESRLNNADAILLIAACLDKYQLNDLQGRTKELSIDSIVEVHNIEELDMTLYSGAEIIGINNRDLHTLKVNLNTTLELLRDIPQNKIVVSESGIKTRKDVQVIEATRVDAILIGTALMEAKDIAIKIDELLDKKGEQA